MREVSCCADRTGNQWFHRREAAENVFGVGLREVGDKSSWVYNGSEHKMQGAVTSLAHSRGVISLEKMTHRPKLWRKDCWVLGGFFSEVIKGSKLRVENTPSRSSVIYLITSERSPLVKQSRGGLSCTSNMVDCGAPCCELHSTDWQITIPHIGGGGRSRPDEPALCEIGFCSWGSAV